MFTKKFWKEAAERAAKTAAQAALGVAVLAEGFNAFTVDWAGVAGVAAGGAVLSLLFSIASAPFGPEGSPSVVGD
jgi:hypothetical protein